MSSARTSRSFAAWAAVALLCGCADASNGGARDVRLGGERGKGEPLSQAELQEDVQRFTGTFMDRVIQAADPLTDAPDVKLREAGMQRVLLYASSALDIASGPLPEVNVLDMMVLVKLSRGALERHWIPQLFGERGRPLAVALADSDRELKTIADKLLSPDQQAKLLAAIDEWEAAHPDQHRVESVRFYQFSSVAGEVSEERAHQARGLLSQVARATAVADQALLFGDRAMFLAQRVPFLVRAQARLGVQQTISDTTQRFGEFESVLEHMPDARLMLRDLAAITSNSAEAARESRMLLTASQPLIDLIDEEPGPVDEPRIPLREIVESSERMTSNTVEILRELREVAPGNPAQAWDAAERRADRLVRRWIFYLMLLGAAWALVFWGGYFVVKRRLTARPGGVSP